MANGNRQARSASEKCPISLLTTVHPEVTLFSVAVHPTGIVDYTLATFIFFFFFFFLEACGKAVNSILLLLSGIPHCNFQHVKTNLGTHNAPNMINKKKHEINYPRHHNAMDWHFKQLCSMGIGVQHTQAHYTCR